MSNIWQPPAGEPPRPFDPYDISPTEHVANTEQFPGQGYDPGGRDPSLPYGMPPAPPYDPPAQHFAPPQYGYGQPHPGFPPPPYGPGPHQYQYMHPPQMQPPHPVQQTVMVNGGNGKGVNHVLHLLLTIFTAGLWLPVWIILAMAKS